MGNYVYIAKLIEDLCEIVFEYAVEVEHQFMDEYQNMTKKELRQDFAQYLISSEEDRKDE